MGQRIVYAVDRWRRFDACETVQGALGGSAALCGGCAPLGSNHSISRALSVIHDWSCW